MPHPPLVLAQAGPDDLPVVREMLRDTRHGSASICPSRASSASSPGFPATTRRRTGALLVARQDGGRRHGRPSPSGRERCEMKRLYVRPAGASRAAWAARWPNACIAEARERGYASNRARHAAVMSRAQSMYVALGFRDIAPYYPSPDCRHALHGADALTAGGQSLSPRDSPCDGGTVPVAEGQSRHGMSPDSHENRPVRGKSSRQRMRRREAGGHRGTLAGRSERYHVRVLRSQRSSRMINKSCEDEPSLSSTDSSVACRRERYHVRVLRPVALFLALTLIAVGAAPRSAAQGPTSSLRVLTREGARTLATVTQNNQEYVALDDLAQALRADRPRGSTGRRPDHHGRRAIDHRHARSAGRLRRGTPRVAAGRRRAAGRPLAAADRLSLARRRPAARNALRSPPRLAAARRSAICACRESSRDVDSDARPASR